MDKLYRICRRIVIKYIKYRINKLNTSRLITLDKFIITIVKYLVYNKIYIIYKKEFSRSLFLNRL